MLKELDEMSLEELWTLFPIFLTEHKREWDEWYQEESSLLQSILVNVKRIAHIGSTAINGIWAKPIVDILIETTNKNDYDIFYNLLQTNGYLCMNKNERRMTFNKGYTKYGFAERVFHIHIRFEGDHDELYFRDFLNDHTKIAKEYESLKLSLWKKYEHNRDAYTEAKTDFVRKNTEKAKEEYFCRYE